MLRRGPTGLSLIPGREGRTVGLSRLPLPVSGYGSSPAGTDGRPFSCLVQQVLLPSRHLLRPYTQYCTLYLACEIMGALYWFRDLARRARAWREQQGLRKRRARKQRIRQWSMGMEEDACCPSTCFEVRTAGGARGAGRKRKAVSRLRVCGSSHALRFLLEFRFEHTEIHR